MRTSKSVVGCAWRNEFCTERYLGRLESIRRAIDHARASTHVALLGRPVGDRRIRFRGFAGYNDPQAPVAQLDRVLPSEGRGREFESRRARQLFLLNNGLRGSLQRSQAPVV